MTADFQDSQHALEQAVTVAILQQKLIQLENELVEIKNEQSSIKDSMNSALRLGILTLGGAVLSMATWIFAHIKQLIV